MKLKISQAELMKIVTDHLTKAGRLPYDTPIAVKFTVDYTFDHDDESIEIDDIHFEAQTLT